jgi:hypothetical protein
MEFRIGAANGRMELNEQMAEIWKGFEASVSLPFQYSRWAYAGGVGGIAGADLVVESHPEFRAQEFSRIVVDADKFLALDDGRRFLTLLHESLHLASFLGVLRSTVQVKHALGRQYDLTSPLTGDERPYDDLDRQKISLGFLLADQLLEFDAETALKSRYPEHAVKRATYYIEMRRTALQERRWLRPLEPVRPYALLLEWLRLDLGLLLTASDSTLKEEATSMSSELDTLLKESATARNRIERLKARLRCSALDETFQTAAPQIYTDVFNDVLSIEGL